MTTGNDVSADHFDLSDLAATRRRAEAERMAALRDLFAGLRRRWHRPARHPRSGGGR